MKPNMLYVQWKPSTACQYKNHIPSVKHDGEERWGYRFFFAATGSVHLAIIKSTMLSCVYQNTLESNVKCHLSDSLSLTQFDQWWQWQWSLTQKNGWKRRGSTCFNDPVKVQTLGWLKCCGWPLRELCMNKFLNITMNWSEVVQRSGEKHYTSIASQLKSAPCALGTNSRTDCC